MPVDIYRVAKHGEGVLRAWKVTGVLFVYLMRVGNFSRIEFRLSDWLVVNLGSALLMKCSCAVCVCECELVRDHQGDQDVVLKLSYRPSRSGMTKQVS
jgi:hypothetical protein